MLAKMTSRIHDYFHIEPSLFITIRENPTKTWAPDELVNLGFQVGYDASPGSGWGYSNTNTILIGQENDPGTLFTRFVHILHGPDF